MEELSESQLRRRGQFEAAIAVAAPFLELVLAAGDRLSRLVEPKDYEYYPVREGSGTGPAEASAGGSRGAVAEPPEGERGAGANRVGRADTGGGAQ